MLVNQLGEDGIISRMRGIFAQTSSGVPLAIGDDAAVIDSPAKRQMVWTTDLVLEGIHFKRSWLKPRDLGRRALAVSLSDLAAMGAEPACALFSLACDDEERVETLLDVCSGLSDMAFESGTAIVGGDTSRSPGGLMLSVAAGGTVSPGQAVARSGAVPGETVYVTGYLGSAAAGLRLLEEDLGEESSELCRAFINPVPRLEAGEAVADMGASAMIDLSDGLASDLRHICTESRAGAEILLDRIPVTPGLIMMADEQKWNLEEMVLGGGEDYELLFTAEAARATEIESYSRESGLPITAIGEIKGIDNGINVVGRDGVSRPLVTKGFDHFHESR